MPNIFVVMIGCAFGGAFRYLITTYINKFSTFPYGTLTVNLIGCFLIGVISTFLTEYCKTTSLHISLFLSVGFLGGLTTFSSFSNETMILLKAGSILPALFNIGLNTIGGLVAVWVGIVVVRVLN